MLFRFSFVLTFTLASGGCVSTYLYESRGSVVLQDGQTTGALLYWKGDDGRLWYGKRYRQIDSGVSMIVCGEAPKSFDGGEADDPVMIKSRPGDRQVLRVDSDGSPVPMAEPRQLAADANCGQIASSGKPLPSDALEPGMAPQVSVLCDNPQRPGRYPQAGVYDFEAISREKVKGHVEPTDVCAAAAETPTPAR